MVALVAEDVTGRSPRRGSLVSVREGAILIDGVIFAITCKSPYHPLHQNRIEQPWVCGLDGCGVPVESFDIM